MWQKRKRWNYSGYLEVWGHLCCRQPGLNIQIHHYWRHISIVGLLTFIYTVDVRLFRHDSIQTLHQQQCFMVALPRSWAAVKHFIQRCRLHLNTPRMAVRDERERATRQQDCGMCTHHVHSVAVQQLFCCQPTEAVYKLLFVEQERL